MGAPKVPKPTKPPPPPDETKAQLKALAFAETERRLRQGSGRRSTFLTGGGGNAPGGKPLLGM